MNVTIWLYNILEANQFDTDAAVKQAVNEAMSPESDIQELFARPLVARAIRAMVKAHGRRHRSAVFNRGIVKSVPTCQKGTSGESMQTGITGAVLAYSMLTQDAWANVWLGKAKKRLGDATREDLANEINMYAEQARGCDRKRQFYTFIRNRLTDGQKVSDVFSEKDLTEINRKTYYAAEAVWNNKFAEPDPAKERVRKAV